MDLHERIAQQFHESIRTKQMAMDRLAPAILEAGERMTRALQAENKILACGNGGRGDLKHFVRSR
ncbi:MAG: hypothetical protein U5L11_10100 [Arhodomonas sp.]|nr:hypothetical protein [Arhodomonas sp.]